MAPHEGGRLHVTGRAANQGGARAEVAGQGAKAAPRKAGHYPPGDVVGAHDVEGESGVRFEALVEIAKETELEPGEMDDGGTPVGLRSSGDEQLVGCALDVSPNLFRSHRGVAIRAANAR